jgi:hypothetical protein
MSDGYEAERRREERWKRIRANGSTLTEERRRELRAAENARLRRASQGAAKPSSAAKLPAAPGDPIPPLAGEFDLVYPVHVAENHTTGDGNDWLFLTGFPRQLRSGGWVYLKVGDEVVARATVRSIGYREDVEEHTPDDQGIHDKVDFTATLEVDPDSWERVSFPADDRHLQGIRYLRTNDDDTIDHLVGGEISASYEITRIDG